MTRPGNTPVDFQHEKTPDGRYEWTDAYMAWFLENSGKAEPITEPLAPPITVTVNEHYL